MGTKRIVNCAITGSIHTPSMSPYLPITPTDIAQHAIDAANAGAASVHIHVRDPETGKPSPSLELYRQVIDRIRAVNRDVIICLTTGGGLNMTVEERGAVIPAFRPELASMNAGSINWGLFPIAEKIENWRYDWEKPALEATTEAIFSNTFGSIQTLLGMMEAHGTTPELECYDVGHLYNLKYFKDAGILKKRPYLQFVMGVNGAIAATPYDLLHMKETADRIFGENGYEWSAFGAGRFEFPVCLQNLFLGGHVRVGMEDNLNLSKGIPAKNNAELVEKMVRLMRELDYEPTSPDEARQILGTTQTC